MPELTQEQLADAQGRPVLAAGEPVGEVETIYLDNRNGRPEWLGIRGEAFEGRKLVPAADAELHDEGLNVPYRPEVIAAAPSVDAEQIDESTEMTLYEHYGVAEHLRTITHDVPEPAAEAPGAESVTRSEEELLVGKRPVRAGEVRLRKWVETEPVTVDVELQRETVRVVRESLDEPVDTEIGEAEIAIELQAEEPIVRKQTVAKERISLAKEVETDVHTVEDEVRRERVEIEGDEIVEGSRD